MTIHKDALGIFSLVMIIFMLCSNQVNAESAHPVADGKKLYTHYCAPCHGNRGDGKGFNAKNLDPRPAKHNDDELMSRRSDKDLYDVINGGGRSVGKSTLMPPWGETLDNAQIKSLVLYLRKLCHCQGM